jgi:hypothetical protein
MTPLFCLNIVVSLYWIKCATADRCASPLLKPFNTLLRMHSCYSLQSVNLNDYSCNLQVVFTKWLYQSTATCCANSRYCY